MNKKEEIWKDIPNYEGYYQASSLGRVRSLDRWITYSNGQERFYKGGIMRGGTQAGYKFTTLKISGQGRAYKVSQLVAMAFLGHEPNGYSLVVDHINGDRSDDRVENLRIVTQRENSSTCFRSNEESFSSQYVGVHWNKEESKWRAQIVHNGVNTFLGYYDTEIEASKAYQLALSKIKDGSFNTDDYKPKWTSKYKGVCFKKANNKWVAQITINGKSKHIGYFSTEILAHEAYLKAEKENNLSTS